MSFRSPTACCRWERGRAASAACPSHAAEAGEAAAGEINQRLRRFLERKKLG